MALLPPTFRHHFLGIAQKSRQSRESNHTNVLLKQEEFSAKHTVYGTICGTPDDLRGTAIFQIRFVRIG